MSRMLIARRAVLRGIRAGSAATDGEAIDRVSSKVILSEGLAFDGWDELCWASGNQGGMNRRLGCDYGPISDGFRCSSDAAFSVAEKRKESWRLIICSDALWLTFFILLPTTHSNHPPKPQTQGVVSYKLQMAHWMDGAACSQIIGKEGQ